MKLETAKELKRVADEFGVELPKAENIMFISKELEQKHYYNEHGLGYDVPDDWVVDDYTTDELLEWLGDLTSITHSLNQYIARKEFIDGTLRKTKAQAQADTSSEALALLAIELIKNKVIK